MKMKLLFFAFIFLYVFQVTGQKGWYELTSGTTNQLYSVYFTDEDHGYAVGRNGTILKTIDGGSNWDTIPSPTGAHLFSVFFIDDTTGYAVSGQSIIKTTDAGISWALQNTVKAGNSVYFPSTNIGFVVGDYGSIVKTMTASITWMEMTSGTSEHLKSVFFINENVGLAVGENGTIIKSTDGGITWSPVTSGTNYNLVDVQFVNATTGYISGTKTSPLSGIILKSTDAGNTWTNIQNVNYQLEGMHFPTIDTGYVFGFDPGINKGLIFKTTDAGTSWVKQSSPTNQTLYEGYFLDGNLGFAVGVYGTIIKTTNGGVSSGIGIDENNKPADVIKIQCHPNPFIKSINIDYWLKTKTNVTIRISDITGKVVSTLIDNYCQSGYQSIIWDRSNDNGAKVNEGMYFIAFILDDLTITKKLLVLD